MIRWYRRGCGIATVLVHGFSGSPDSWRDVVPLLPPQLDTVVAPVLPGHGAGMVVEVGFRANVRRVADAIVSIGASQYHLVGYSLGARVALALLAENMVPAASLCLIGVNPGLSLPAERDQRRCSDGEWAQVLRTQGIAAFVTKWEALPLFASLAERVMVAAEVRRIRLSHDSEQMARSLEHMGLAEMPNYGSDLGRATVPVCLVVGARDHKFRSIADGVVAEWPKIQRFVVEGAGHNVVAEEPERLAALITDWIQEQSATRA